MFARVIKKRGGHGTPQHRPNVGPSPQQTEKNKLPRDLTDHSNAMGFAAKKEEKGYSKADSFPRTQKKTSRDQTD